jgi:hypothetical protein
LSLHIGHFIDWIEEVGKTGCIPVVALSPLSATFPNMLSNGHIAGSYYGAVNVIAASNQQGDQMPSARLTYQIDPRPLEGILELIQRIYDERDFPCPAPMFVNSRRAIGSGTRQIHKSPPHGNRKSFGLQLDLVAR